jgi:hypothetical protein
MYYVIVRRGDFQKFDLLHKTFGTVTSVVWDQRVHERRRSVDPRQAEDRRRLDRRGPVPVSWKALGFVVAERAI